VARRAEEKLVDLNPKIYCRARLTVHTQPPAGISLTFVLGYVLQSPQVPKQAGSQVQYCYGRPRPSRS
jgi:hypothetical protein